MSKTNENPDHTVWTIEIAAAKWDVTSASKVFATEELAQKCVDKMNKEDLFKVKKVDVNPARKPKQR